MRRVNYLGGYKIQRTGDKPASNSNVIHSEINLNLLARLEGGQAYTMDS